MSDNASVAAPLVKVCAELTALQRAHGEARAPGAAWVAQKLEAIARTVGGVVDQVDPDAGEAMRRDGGVPVNSKQREIIPGVYMTRVRATGEAAVAFDHPGGVQAVYPLSRNDMLTIGAALIQQASEIQP